MDVESQRLVGAAPGPSTRDSDSVTDDEQQAVVRVKGFKGFLEGPLVLLTVAFFWGTFSPALKALYETPGPPDPAMLTAVRTTIQVMPFAA